MKKNIMLASVLFSALSIFCFSPANVYGATPSKLGVVQLDKLYTESKIGHAAFERLNFLQNKAVTTLDALQKQLEKAKADKNQKEEERLQKQVQGTAYFMQNVLKADQENVAKVIDAALKQAYDQYISFHTDTAGIVRSDLLASFNPTIDITGDVKEILDKLPIDFGEMPSLEAPKLPEPENATTPLKQDEQAKKSAEKSQKAKQEKK